MTHALRVIQSHERPTPQEGDPQRLRDIIDMPAWMFARGLASIDAAAMTYECEVHGIILPRKFANGFRRRECPCMWEQRQQEGMARYQEAMQHTLGTKQAERCYTWLGKDAEELGLEGKTFENFKMGFQDEALSVCSHYNPLKDARNLLLLGKVGTGKTHLAAAILNGLRASGIPCLFTTVQNLFDAYYAANFDEKQSIVAQLGSTNVAAFDDFGKLYVKQETEGAYQKGVMFKILDRRYTRNLPTIITFNADPLLPESSIIPFLEKWLDEATVDRLYERRILLRMNGKSYRRVLAEQHKNGA